MTESSKQSKFENGPDHRLVRGASSNKAFIITIGIAVVLLAALWIWKSVAVNDVRKEAARNSQILKEQASSQMIQSHIQHLKILAKAYVWAARKEMMLGNNNQLNLYAKDMVSENNFQQISVADDKGIIISSTNKKYEGQPFSTISNASYLRDDSTHVENSGDSVLTMTSPIMGFNNRLGTLLITYKIVSPVFR